jgi:hypothetical protein
MVGLGYRADEVDLIGESGVYSPSRHDSVARAASQVIGGPAGRRLASATGFWRSVPVLVLLGCAVLSLGLVQKQHCRAQGWAAPDQFWHACYSDIPVLYGSAALGSSTRPGLVESVGQGGLGQPPLAGALMWITSAFVPNHGSSAGRQFFDLSAVLLVLVLAIAVAAVAVTARRRSWDAAHLALSPVLITAGLISYELLAVALTSLALLALSRGRPVLGGVMLGLAVASAPQIAVLGLVVVILASQQLRTSIGMAFAGSAIACWLVVRVLLLPGWTGGLGSAWTTWRSSVPGYGSLWLVPQLLGSSAPNPATSRLGRALGALVDWMFRARALNGTTASILALVLLVVLTGWVLLITVGADFAEAESVRSGELGSADARASGRRAADEHGSDLPVSDGQGSDEWVHDLSSDAQLPPGSGAAWLDPVPNLGEFVTRKVAPLTLALLAVVLLTAKSLPVQTSLLLLPLIALSGLRWRDHLIWAGTELVYFIGIWLYIAGETTPSRGMPASFYLVLILARLSGIAWLGIQGVLVYRFGPPLGNVIEPGCGQSTDGTSACGQISSQVADAGRLPEDRSTQLPHRAG